MAEMITCPVCGTQNPANQAVCQRCQTPLNNALFQPGQSPVHKDTGELEPLLPQWLKDARQSAKEEGETQQQTQQPPKPEAPAKPAASSTDFLAGLQSQAGDDDDEEIPDWLASITGTPAPKQKPNEVVEEPSGTRWVETGNKSDFQQAEPEAEEEVPSWLTGMQQQPNPDEKDELTDWFRSSSSEAPSAQPLSFEQPQQSPTFNSAFTPSASNDTPDWLKQMAANAGEKEPESASDSSFGSSDWFSQPAESNPAPQADPFAQSSDTPDWLHQMQENLDSSSQQQPSASPFAASSGDSDLPDWLNQMQAGAVPAEPAQPAEPFNLSSDTPDWLNQMRSDSTPAESAPSAEPFSFSSDTPDWLSQLPADNAASQQPAADPFNASSSADMPDLLSGLGSVPSGENSPFVESTPAESEPFSSNSDLPSWLAPEQDAAKKTDSKPRWLQSDEEVASGEPAWLASNDKTLVPESEQAADETPVNDVFSDMPDWLKSAAPASTIFDDAPAFETPKAETPKQQPSSPFESAPAFSEDAFPAQNDALFTEMPDWLSNAMEEPASGGMIPEPIKGGDALAPDILPSWVEAMRPSDQGMFNIVNAANDATLESRGALAGLSGVLPLGAGFAPTSKPKAYSIKLNASDEQVKHAGILEQILAAETSAVSLTSEKSLGSSRVLRWSIAFVLFIVTILTSFLGTQIFSTPQAQPNELKLAVAVSQAIPDSAPVLVAVDYEASRAGEIEAAAAPLFDNMLLLKHPRLTFVSSNESGAILAERLMNGPLAFHVQNGVSYLNLGYLSGGQMGIRAFAQNPTSVAPSDVNGQPAWASPVLQNVTALNQFALIILLTDDADAARAWVEQTEDSRGAVPILVVSSAQSAPMIYPYYDSGQVAGIVSGLYGGAIFEQQYNNGRPGLARNYWDAYSIGMLLAMLLLVVGGLVNLGLGVRDHNAMREGK